MNQQKIKKYKISDVNMNHIALVMGDLPAVPDATVIMSKSWVPKGYSIIEKSISTSNKEKVAIIKADAEQQIIWARALVPDVVDRQGDIITLPEIEKARVQFMKNLQNGNIKGTNGISMNHIDFSNDYGFIVDSFIDYNGTYLQKGANIPGAWIVGMKLSNNAWELYKNNKITGISIGGVGSREALSKTSLNKSMMGDEEDCEDIYSEGIECLSELASSIVEEGPEFYTNMNDRFTVMASLMETIRLQSANFSAVE